MIIKYSKIIHNYLIFKNYKVEYLTSYAPNYIYISIRHIYINTYRHADIHMITDFKTAVKKIRNQNVHKI